MRFQDLGDVRCHAHVYHVLVHGYDHSCEINRRFWREETEGADVEEVFELFQEIVQMTFAAVSQKIVNVQYDVHSSDGMVKNARTISRWRAQIFLVYGFGSAVGRIEALHKALLKQSVSYGFVPPFGGTVITVEWAAHSFYNKATAERSWNRKTHILWRRFRWEIATLQVCSINVTT